MEVTAQELAKQYAEMEDEPLLALAAERADLTPMAQDLLLSELRNRRLAVPSVSETSEETEQTYADERIVTVRRFATLMEGVSARGALEAAGIPCFLRDEHTTRTLWHLSGMIGGVRLDVPESFQEQAAQVLVTFDAAELDIPIEPDAEALLGPDYVCPQCGSIEVNRVSGPSLTETLKAWLRKEQPSGDQRWKCNDCGFIWVDNERE